MTITKENLSTVNLCHQPKKHLEPSCLLLLLMLLTLASALAAQAQDRVASVALFKKRGDQVDWCKATGEIVYASRGADNLYGIHTCTADGGNDFFITDKNPNVPPFQKGSPCWHPSGKYILFVAEKAAHAGGHFGSTPGLGNFSDLWIMTADGGAAWPLTDMPLKGQHGVIIPRFSHDGRRIVWAERYERCKLINPRQICGWWDLKVADFVETPKPHLTNIHTIRPGGVDAFNESYGFTPDDRSIIFCSDYTEKSFWSSQIFTCNADTGGDIKRLTSKNYNEHACYSSDGKSIVWMTSAGEGRGTDWWIMNADGTNKRQMTFFNVPGHPESSKHRMTCCLGVFSPDDKRFLGGIQTSILLQQGDSYMVTFK